MTAAVCSVWGFLFFPLVRGHFCGAANTQEFLAHAFSSVHSCPAVGSSLNKKPLITVNMLRLTLWKIRIAYWQDHHF